MKVLSTILFLLLLTFGLATADLSEEGLFVNARAEARNALEQLQAEYPATRVYKTSGRVSRVFGTTFGSGISPESAADNFRLNHSLILGALAEDLRPESQLQDKRHSQQLMYNPQTNESKFTLVYYSQYRDDIPVFRSEMRILVRNLPENPVVMAISNLHYLGDFSAASKGAINSNAAEANARAEIPTLTEFSEMETVIYAGVEDIGLEPRLAVKFVGSSDFPERWLFVADAETGEILYKEDMIIFEDVVGTVEGIATEGTAAEHCEDEIVMPMPYARVNIGGTVAYADVNGDYVLPNGGTSSVSVESRVWGEFFRVFNYVGADALITHSVVPPGPADFLHNPANTEYTRAEVNAYIQSNIIRDIVLEHNPTYPAVSTQFEFPIYVNRSDGYCPGNAWYDPGDQSINFCETGGSYPNTAWQSVIHHEYGHHLVNMAGSGQGQYGEGMGDVMAILWADEPELGIGFYGDCGTPLRNADNTIQYPCSGGIHDCGQLISGCVWDLRNELIVIYPTTYLDTLARLAINSMLLHTGTEITPQITIDFLTLDDDDANLDNGTPHRNEICAAFGAHSMDCPELTPIWFEYPSGKPDIVTPNTTTPVDVIVHIGSVAPISGTGVLYYSIDGAPFQVGTMTETVPNEYEITLPAAGCESSINWYVSAEASGFGTVYDPSDAPTSSFQVIAANSVVTVLADNFETNQGWVVSGAVDDGDWERGTPAGGGVRGDPPTDFDGSGQCYLTDNVYGNSDVDGGTTSLTSPVIDLSGGDATIHYARWYSNTYGADPNNDEMYVYVSNNKGIDWTLVETVGPVYQANGGWYENSFLVSDFVTPTDEVKVRFDASDLSAGSVVEAGVDDFIVKSFVCDDQPTIITADLDDWTAGVPYSEQLNASGGVGQLTWTDKNGDLVGTGLSLSPTGLLSGTPLSVGPITFTAVVTDEARSSAEKLLSLTINASVQVTTETLADWTAGQAYTEQLNATGGTAPLSWLDRDGDMVGSGLAVAGDGAISGTPGSAGVINFTARVGDNVGDLNDKALSITINPAVAITTGSLPDGIDGSPYSEQLVATGGTGTKSWTDKNGDLSGTGLTLSPEGLLSGTPTSASTIAFTAAVVDNTGSNDEASLSLVIGPAFICGDVNADTLVNIFDITYIVEFLYRGGPPPDPMESGDVNNDGLVNIFDVTYLINFLYKGGPAPGCP